MGNNNEWQVVQSSKARSKPKNGDSKVASNNNLLGSENVQRDPAGAALAQLDADWSQRNGAQKANGTSNTTGAYASLQVEASPPPSPKAAPNAAQTEQPKKAPKVKKPKVKKITASEIAGGITIEDLRLVLSDFEDKYGSDEHSQLERVADYFLGSFKDADIPFNKTVLEQPLSKAGEVPLRDLPQEIIDLMTKFFRRKNAKTLADFAFSLIKVFLTDIPETNPSKTPRKAKVGLLISIALILRSRPEVLLLLDKDLLSHAASFSTPGRLPFQLWVLQQASSANPAVGIAVWARVILPQALGQPLPTLPNQKSSPDAASLHPLGANQVDLALKFAEEVFVQSEKSMETPPKVLTLGPPGQEPRGTHGLYALTVTRTDLSQHAEKGIALQEGSDESVLPVVPPEVLDAILRTCYTTSPPTRTALRNRLLTLRANLKDLVLVSISSGHVKPADAVRLLLDTATSAAENPGPSGESHEAVEEASNSLLEYIHVHPKGAASAWEQRHKHQIKGSSAIIQHLATYPHYLQTFLKSPARRQLMLDTLRHLKDRHRGLLATGKGWQQAAARSAEAAASELSHKIVTKRRRNTAVSGLLGTILVSLLVVFLARQDIVKDLVKDLRNRSSVAEQVASHLEKGLTASQARIHDLTESTVGPAWSSVHEWGVAEYNAKLKPHVGSVVSSAVEQVQLLAEKALAYLQK